MEIPNPWRSPGGMAVTMVPRVRPRRAKRGPSRPMRREATAEARCSCSMATAPVAHLSPIEASAGARISV